VWGNAERSSLRVIQGQQSIMMHRRESTALDDIQD
jgi:hypothetical protein